MHTGRGTPAVSAGGESGFAVRAYRAGLDASGGCREATPDYDRASAIDVVACPISLPAAVRAWASAKAT